jgi:hypothetical protein
MGGGEFYLPLIYYEHIICNDKDLNNIRDYIVNNPLKCQEDNENPN